MAFAPTHTNFAPHGDGSIRGSFRYADTKVFFEFSAATDDEMAFFGTEFDMKVWLAGDNWRFAKVLKTVTHVVVDEDAAGNPVVERWQTRGHELFTDPNN